MLRGAMLEKVRDFVGQFLDTHVANSKFRYQGSDFHIMTEQHWSERKDESHHHSPVVDELIELPAVGIACEALGLEGLRSVGSIIILNKPAHGPALYWHQDNMQWNHPKSALPWPTQIFLSIYTVDTHRENGCLRVIPGTHVKRIPLHDALPAAHGPELQESDDSHPAFAEHPDEIDVCARAGDLVIADARVLHAAWQNQTDERRPLVLAWWNVFPFPSVPTWWEEDLPEETQVDPTIEYEATRMPGEYLRP
jgi:hypothetical protein